MAKRGPKVEADFQKYRDELGDEEYVRQYNQIRQKTIQHLKKDVRFSGREYTNSAEKLEALKKKYAGGVKREDVERLVDRLLENLK